MHFRRVCVSVLASAALCLNYSAMSDECLVYFGTYTGGTSKGIYVSKFDSDKGQLTPPELAIETTNPSYIALHPTKPVLYAVSEVALFDGKPTGAVSAFKIQDGSGKLSLINQQPSGGRGPCHVSLDSKGRCVLVANYSSGSVASFPVQKDGSLGAAVSTIQHSGSSINPKRQTGPHAHQAVVSPDDRFALVCDLGLDKALVYKLDAGNASLEPNTVPFATVQPGAGPRHIDFRPDGKFLFLINELNSTMSAFAYDKREGRLTMVDTVPTLPEDFKDTSWCAGVAVHPNSKFVYGSNRGHDSIVVFEADKKTGKLTPIQHISSGGKYPRFFMVHHSGRWLITLNQNSGDIVVYALDPKTGKLQQTGARLMLESPVCAVCLPIRPDAKRK